MDVHPHGTRVATAGSDHKVKIWNMLPVTDVQQELSAVMPKLLATLADHYAPVNVARFSRSGKHLATGAAQMHPHDSEPRLLAAGNSQAQRTICTRSHQSIYYGCMHVGTL